MERNRCSEEGCRCTELRRIERQQLELERAQDDFERSRASFEREKQEERKFLEQRELQFTIALSERLWLLEQDENRAKASQADHEKKIEEDRNRLAEEIENFEIAQIKWEEDRKMLQINYDKLQTNLAAGYRQLRRDQSALEERLQSKMDDIMQEHMNLTCLEKGNKLKDLAETYVDYCELYAHDSEKLTHETEFFQRKFKLQLKKLKNAMPSGDNFLPMLEQWTEGTVLNKKMLLYLHSQGGVSSNSVQCADLQDRRDLEQILSSFNASTALPSTTEKVRAIESSFHKTLQEVDQLRDRALAGSSNLAAIQPSLNEEKEHQ